MIPAARTLPDLAGRWASFWVLQFIGWTIYFVAVYITFLTIAPPGNALFLLLFKAFRAFTGFILTSVVLRPVYRRFGSGVPVEHAVALVLICSALLSVVWTAIEFAYVSLVSVAPSVPGYLARSPRIALDYAMTLAAWSALYLGVTFGRRFQTARENALEAVALTHAAQLQMLRYQINPHFLFNALNSVRALIDEDGARAKVMITRLSEFLRHSLMREDQAMVRLSEELDAVANYLEIEKIRFEEKLEFSFDVDEAAKGREVPSFLLNPLVENAVKHGLRSSPRPLRIKVRARVEAGVLTVEVLNTGSLGGASAIDDTAIGLQNVRRRLEKVYGSAALMELTQRDEWVSARIEIPA